MNPSTALVTPSSPTTTIRGTVAAASIDAMWSTRDIRDDDDETFLLSSVLAVINYELRSCLYSECT